MKKYIVQWQHFRDLNAGEPFTVEADNPDEAYCAAVDYLESVVKGFSIIGVKPVDEAAKPQTSECKPQSYGL